MSFVVVAWFVAGDFGPTWDFVFGEYAQGERYLAYLRTLDPVHLDFTNPAGRPVFDVPHLDDSTGSFRAHECHQLPGWMSALGCAVLYRGLELASCVAAHHAWAVLASAMLVFVLAWFAVRQFDRTTAVFAVAALVTSPRFFVDSMTNIKDGPECALFCITLLVWFDQRERPTLRTTVFLGLLNGIALAQKLNASFIPIQLLLIVGLTNLLRKVRGEAPIPVPWRYVPVYGIAALVGWVVPSPMFWRDPLTNITYHLHYFWNEAGLDVVKDQIGAAFAVAVTTPLPVLALALVGLWVLRRRGDAFALVFVGAVFPIARHEIPGAVNFDGIRHLLEFFPFVALAAGVGGAAIVGGLSRSHPKRRALAAAATFAVAFTPSVVAIARTHPNEVCWFNELVGGFGGAQHRKIAGASDYWANSYWQAIDWLNDHATPKAWVLTSVAPHVMQAAAPLKLRPDLRLVGRDLPPWD
ncbi:MAG: glycosyltransferase family 39 protein, partial [Planctomycetes bacterium]|nr:glycosyltransferase family 39 protein [Planctomycetota bacterium]